MKKPLIFAAVTSALLSVSYGDDNSLIVFDNLSPTEPYYANGGSWFGTRPINPDLTCSLANGFTPSSSGYLQELWLGITTYASKKDFTLSLYSDSNGCLDTQLWQQSFTGVIASGDPLMPVNATARSTTPIQATTS